MTPLRQPGLPGAPALLALAGTSVAAADVSTNAPDASLPGSGNGLTAAIGKPADAPPQAWNWHVQNTDIVQGYPGFRSSYSGPNSLPAGGETRETVSLDVPALKKTKIVAAAGKACLPAAGQQNINQIVSGQPVEKR